MERMLERMGSLKVDQNISLKTKSEVVGLLLLGHSSESVSFNK
jgi:hypothetical protein